MQGLAGILPDAGPRLALAALDVLDSLIKLPRDLTIPAPGAPSMIDRSISKAMMKNKGVIEPLMLFCISNASQRPSTDLERVAMARGAGVVSTLIVAARTDFSVDLERAWADSRYV